MVGLLAKPLEAVTCTSRPSTLLPSHTNNSMRAVEKAGTNKDEEVVNCGDALLPRLGTAPQGPSEDWRCSCQAVH